VRLCIYLGSSSLDHEHQPQVIITSSPTNSQTSDHPNRRVARLGVHSLPEAIQRSFADTFVPCVVSKVGCSSEPWHRVRVKDLQSLFALVYPNHDLTITRGDALESAVRCTIPNSSLAHTHISQDQFEGYVLQEHCREAGPRKRSGLYEAF